MNIILQTEKGFRHPRRRASEELVEAMFDRLVTPPARG